MDRKGMDDINISGLSGSIIKSILMDIGVGMHRNILKLPVM